MVGFGPGPFSAQLFRPDSSSTLHLEYQLVCLHCVCKDLTPLEIPEPHYICLHSPEWKKACYIMASPPLPAASPGRDGSQSSRTTPPPPFTNKTEEVIERLRSFKMGSQRSMIKQSRDPPLPLPSSQLNTLYFSKPDNGEQKTKGKKAKRQTLPWEATRAPLNLWGRPQP